MSRANTYDPRGDGDTVINVTVRLRNRIHEGSTAGAGGQGAPVDGDSAVPVPAPGVDPWKVIGRSGPDVPNDENTYSRYRPGEGIVVRGPRGNREAWNRGDFDIVERVEAESAPLRAAAATDKGGSTPPRSSRSGDTAKSGSTPENAPGGEKDAAGPAERGAEQSDAGGAISHGTTDGGPGDVAAPVRSTSAEGKVPGNGIAQSAAPSASGATDQEPAGRRDLAASQGTETTAKAETVVRRAGGLLPCPFCGGTVRVSCVDFGEDGAQFECDPCGAMGPWAGDGEEEARRLWNLRARTAGGTP